MDRSIPAELVGLPGDSVAAPAATGRLFRVSRWDAVLVVVAALHGAALLAFPSIPLLAVGLWWNSNTVSHHFIHNPFFRSRVANRWFTAYLTVLLGYPFALWRERHLAHHAEAAGGAVKASPWSSLRRGEGALHCALAVSTWGAIAVIAPWFLLTVYLPGWLLGMALCALQGRYEHLGGGTIGHYGALYNALFFNDGYHVEHHRRAKTHWRRLPEMRCSDAPASRYPPVLRFLEGSPLDALERVARRSAWLRRRLVAYHRRAFRSLGGFEPRSRIAIVGGGLFPRTALAVHALSPRASITLIDRSAEHLAQATASLDFPVETNVATFTGEPAEGFDVVIIPLAYRGDRARLRSEPAADTVFIHDWIWNGAWLHWRRRSRRSGEVRVTVISWLLLKCLIRVDR